MRLQIHHAGAYRHAQRYVQRIDHVFLGLTVSGVVSYRNSSFSCGAADTPWLSLLFPGEETEFEFDVRRENHVIQIDSPDMRPHDDPARAEVRFERTWIEIPRMVHVSPGALSGLRDTFESVCSGHASAVPRDRMRSVIAVHGIIDAFLDSGTRESRDTAARVLRRLLDEDPAGARSLRELAGAVGYSVDHLRVLFEREYQVSPKTYRQQRRMAMVMDLIARTDLPLKSIADRAGFGHASHLSASFRRAFGISPREGIRRYRYGL